MPTKIFGPTLLVLEILAPVDRCFNIAKVTSCLPGDAESQSMAGIWTGRPSASGPPACEMVSIQVPVGVDLVAWWI